MLPHLKPLRILCLFTIVGITASVIPIAPVTHQPVPETSVSKHTLRLLTQLDFNPFSHDLR
ncbi:hypothetical protein ACN4EK_00960 [Pantanalinema rosaneae CENA516]|uniref:hypothetical protein n=1 Tax=Pantanalinema rosaneae TaxID=1620701 RepID=UPI003D6DBE38